MIDVMHLSFFRKTRNTDDGRSSSSRSFSAFVSWELSIEKSNFFLLLFSRLKDIPVSTVYWCILVGYTPVSTHYKPQNWPESKWKILIGHKK